MHSRVALACRGNNTKRYSGYKIIIQAIDEQFNIDRKHTICMLLNSI